MLKNRVLEAIRHTPLDFNGEGNYFDSTICTIWMCSVAFAMLLVATAASSIPTEFLEFLIEIL